MMMKVRSVLAVAALAGLLGGCGSDAEPTSDPEPTVSETPATIFTGTEVDAWTKACGLPEYQSSNLYGIELGRGGESVTITAYSHPTAVQEKAVDLAFFLDDVECILLMMEAPLGMNPRSMWDAAPGTESWDGHAASWYVDGTRLIVTVTGT